MIECGLGGLFIDGGHRGNWVADETCFVDTKRVLVLGHGEDAEWDGKLGTDERGDDAGHRLGLAGVDVHDARVRVRASLELAKKHARKRQIVREHRLPDDLRHRVHFHHRLADDRKRLRLLGRRRFLRAFDVSSSRHRLTGDGLSYFARGSALDGLENLNVAGAPAQISGKGLFDLSSRGKGVFVEERLRRQKNPGCAVATLRRPHLGERDL